MKKLLPKTCLPITVAIKTPIFESYLANQFWLSAGWGRAWQRGRRRRERRDAPSLFPFGVLVAAAVGASLVARGAILVPC